MAQKVLFSGKCSSENVKVLGGTQNGYSMASLRKPPLEPLFFKVNMELQEHQRTI